MERRKYLDTATLGALVHLEKAHEREVGRLTLASNDIKLFVTELE